MSEPVTQGDGFWAFDRRDHAWGLGYLADLVGLGAAFGELVFTVCFVLIIVTAIAIPRGLYLLMQGEATALTCVPRGTADAVGLIGDTGPF